jgi:hypothetical protein
MVVVYNLVAQVRSTKLNTNLGYKQFGEAIFPIRLYLYLNSGVERIFSDRCQHAFSDCPSTHNYMTLISRIS